MKRLLTILLSFVLLALADYNQVYAISNFNISKINSNWTTIKLDDSNLSLASVNEFVLANTSKINANSYIVYAKDSSTENYKIIYFDGTNISNSDDRTFLEIKGLLNTNGVYVIGPEELTLNSFETGNNNLKDGNYFLSDCLCFDNINNSIYQINAQDYDERYSRLTVNNATIDLNGNVINNELVIKGNFKIYDTNSDTVHYYKKVSKTYMLDDTNKTDGDIQATGGAIIAKGGEQPSISIQENAVVSFENINIVGLYSNVGIIANHATVSMNNVNIFGSWIWGNSAEISLIKSIDSDFLLKDCTISNNDFVGNALKRASIIFLTGTTNPHKMVIDGTTAFDDNRIGSTNNPGIMVDSTANNLVEFASTYVGSSTAGVKSIPFDIDHLVNNSNSNKVGCLSTNNSSSFLSKSTYFDANYVLAEEYDSATQKYQMKIVDRVIEQPSSSNNYTYKIENTDVNNLGDVAIKYQWYKTSELNDKSIDNYVDITYGFLDNGNYIFYVGKGARLNLKLKDNVVGETTIKFTSDGNLSSSSGNLTGDPSGYTLVLPAGKKDIYFSSSSATYIKPTSIESTILKEVVGKTTNSASGFNAGEYACVASIYKNNEKKKDFMSNYVVFVGPEHLSVDDFDIDNSGNVYGVYQEKDTKDTALHITGILLSDIKPNTGVSASVNPYEYIKVKYDSNNLTYGTDYMVEDGSIKVILTKQFLDTLTVGDHVINVSIETNTKQYNYDINIKITEATISFVSYKTVKTCID